jgi:hypothetical protein
MELKSHLHNDAQNQFGVYTRGISAYDELKLYEEMMDDRLRLFMEESDSAQGFQVFTDMDGFAGISSKAIQDIYDEYPKKSVFVFGINEPYSDNFSIESRKTRDVNKALFMHDMLTNGSVYVPLNAPTRTKLGRLVESKFETPYLWSACLAAGIENITFPFRWF